ncbi:MAG: Stk1 family PASTA domain-containing Ser/Thr kinase [Erysipelotrichaceae bacterium]|nr:Stk1 family PASTA domain-containing Ser/Thr kinase [Erysipelotrichaceae bacterium]MDD3923970.1 Stk1 family PASTA domain-containing Ser/Thr kinase [Erysipelotrichaceae bacterium]MDD4642811.1 Stk1 family PASTA domain-containing Ser/Thr kinase [Erysipelotrichaceae bacterium]
MNEMIAERYIIVRSLGQGGMADVYLAMDTILNREVAIKILRGDLANDPVALLRFQREANAASAINHPNIVEIYDVGSDNNKQFIVMEYVRGKTLKQLIAQRGALDQKEVVAIMKQLIEATAVAHEANIVHRDIKPQNVLITDDNTVKITDFGIALAQDAIQLTQTDFVMGSVHYLAPELARGELASAQSDIYALGIVMYELLVGEVPFRAESAVQVAMLHMREDVPDLTSINKQIYQSVANIVLKATAKNKYQRYRSATDMLNDLTTVFDEKRVSETKWQIDDNDDAGKTIAIARINKDTKENKDKNILSTTFGVSLIIIAAISMLLIVLLTPWGERDNGIVMIDVTGMSVEQATQELAALNLTITKTIYQITDDIDEGLIISSSPAKDTIVEKGSGVAITVSDGKYFVVGDYKNKTEEEVRALLVGKRITIKVEEEVNEFVRPGLIIRQELLNPGDKIDPNRQYEIKLIVSGYLSFTIPDNLLGMNVFEAQNLLTSKGAMVMLYPLSTDELSEDEKDNIEYNTVVKVTPSSGLYTQYEDTSIVLYYY